MNNRQKAKHFKRLYEQGLPKKPYPVVYQTLPLEHLRACGMFEKREVDFMNGYPEVLERRAAKLLAQQIEPYIRSRMISEEDVYARSVKFSVDVWMERK